MFQVYVTPLKQPGFHVFVFYLNGHVVEGNQNAFNVFLFCFVRPLHAWHSGDSLHTCYHL